MQEFNKVGNFNGKTFLGSNSSKPIVGHLFRDAFRGNVSQGKVATDDILYPGAVVAISNKLNSTAANAGRDLNPNVFQITKLATAAAEAHAIVLVSPTDVLDFGEEAPRPRKNQIISIALIGSGVELYLPVDNSVDNAAGNAKLAYDFAAKLFKVDGAGQISILSSATDGLKYEVKAGATSVTFANSKVVRVKL